MKYENCIRRARCVRIHASATLATRRLRLPHLYPAVSPRRSRSLRDDPVNDFPTLV